MQVTLRWLTLTLIVTAPLLRAQEPAPTPASLDTILLRTDVWQSTQQALDSELATLDFQWISAIRDVARSSAPGLAFQGTEPAGG